MHVAYLILVGWWKVCFFSLSCCCRACKAHQRRKGQLPAAS